jgi:hypothetical protein
MSRRLQLGNSVQNNVQSKPPSVSSSSSVTIDNLLDDKFNGVSFSYINTSKVQIEGTETSAASSTESVFDIYMSRIDKKNNGISLVYILVKNTTSDPPTPITINQLKWSSIHFRKYNNVNEFFSNQFQYITPDDLLKQILPSYNPTSQLAMSYDSTLSNKDKKIYRIDSDPDSYIITLFSRTIYNDLGNNLPIKTSLNPVIDEWRTIIERVNQ